MNIIPIIQKERVLQIMYLTETITIKIRHLLSPCQIIVLKMMMNLNLNMKIVMVVLNITTLAIDILIQIINKRR